MLGWNVDPNYTSQTYFTSISLYLVFIRESKQINKTWLCITNMLNPNFTVLNLSYVNLCCLCCSVLYIYLEFSDLSFQQNRTILNTLQVVYYVCSYNSTCRIASEINTFITWTMMISPSSVITFSYIGFISITSHMIKPVAVCYSPGSIINLITWETHLFTSNVTIYWVPTVITDRTPAIIMEYL